MNTRTRTFMREKLINAMVVALKKNPPKGAAESEIEELESKLGFQILEMSDLDLEANYQVSDTINVAQHVAQFEKECRAEEKKQKEKNVQM